MGESSCPWLCLAMEVTLCYPQSVFVTRFMIQDEMRIGNTQCDNCIIGTVIALQYLACIFQIIACIIQSDEVHLAANILSWSADLVYCSVCACMQTQHFVQLDERDKRPDIAIGIPFPPDLAPEIMPTFEGHPVRAQLSDRSNAPATGRAPGPEPALDRRARPLSPRTQGKPAQGIPTTGGGAASTPEWAQPPPGYPTAK